jgi:hypothetical protein
MQTVKCNNWMPPVMTMLSFDGPIVWELQLPYVFRAWLVEHVLLWKKIKKANNLNVSYFNLKWNWLFKLTRICWFIIGDMIWWYFLQVEIMCRGQPVLPSLQMHNLVDLWFCTSSTSKKLPASVGSSAKDFVMALSYCRKTLPHWDSPLSYLFILCGGLLLYIDIQLRGGKTQVFLLGNLFIYFFNVMDLCDLLLS